MTQVLRLESVSVAMAGRSALSGVDLDVVAGSLIALCGPNGAGKTSLLRLAAGLLRPSAGRVLAFGAPPWTMPPRLRAQRLGYLPQGGTTAWAMPALDIVMLGALGRPPEEARALAVAALAQLEMAWAADRPVDRLSGGERAQVLLARALVSRPPLLLLDEPVAGLDPEASLKVMEALRRACDEGAAVVASLHDLQLAAGCADAVMLLKQGRALASGPPALALSPERLAAAFGVEAHWSAQAFGPALTLRRKARASQGFAGGDAAAAGEGLGGE